MRKVLLVCGFALASVCLVFFSRAAGQAQIVAPQFTADGKLVRPEGDRKWVYVSSGYGMSYSQRPDGMEMFTNVFVTPAPDDYFLAKGKGRDKAICVSEVFGVAP